MFKIFFKKILIGEGHLKNNFCSYLYDKYETFFIT